MRLFSKLMTNYVKTLSKWLWKSRAASWHNKSKKAFEIALLRWCKISANYYS